MGQHLTERVSQLMTKKNITVSGARILIMGFTFKENCPDIRNTRVVDVYNNFRKLGCDVDIFDPWIDHAEVRREYQIDAINAPEKNGYDAILIAVAHNEFKEYTPEILSNFAKPNYVLFDAKYLLNKEDVDGRL
jgi:UDP-N-acetyl-D-galactosamine dehydrogenase